MITLLLTILVMAAFLVYAVRVKPYAVRNGLERLIRFISPSPAAVITSPSGYSYPRHSKERYILPRNTEVGYWLDGRMHYGVVSAYMRSPNWTSYYEITNYNEETVVTVPSENVWETFEMTLGVPMEAAFA